MALRPPEADIAERSRAKGVPIRLRSEQSLMGHDVVMDMVVIDRERIKSSCAQACACL